MGKGFSSCKLSPFILDRKRSSFGSREERVEEAKSSSTISGSCRCIMARDRSADGCAHLGKLQLQEIVGLPCLPGYGGGHSFCCLCFLVCYCLKFMSKVFWFPFQGFYGTLPLFSLLCWLFEEVRGELAPLYTFLETITVVQSDPLLPSLFIKYKVSLHTMRFLNV